MLMSVHWEFITVIITAKTPLDHLLVPVELVTVLPVMDVAAMVCSNFIMAHII